jgi:DNA repair protein RecN (Recombination protein N)
LPPHPKAAEELLRNNDFDTTENLILSRELVRGGRSMARINSRAVNISLLRDLGRLLVNIHGQREHMLLLEEGQQLLLLDNFSETIAPMLEQAAATYQAMTNTALALNDYLQNQASRTARIEELSFIINELDQAELRLGEDEELRAEANILAHGEKLYQLATDGIDALNNNGAALDKLGDTLTALKTISALDPQSSPLCQRQENLFFEAEDIVRELSAYRERVNLDAYRLEAVEARISALGKLQKKYQGSIDDLIILLSDAKNEKAALEELSFSGDSLYKQRDEAENAYNAAAAALSEARKDAAERLGKAVTKELQMLSMPAAFFKVDLPAHPPSALGNERALFMIRPNTGEPFQPVAKIASGGELSRIVLGIKVILSRLDTVPTLIFDEVDTGLSGKALISVSQRIALVGESAQVIVVTHNAVMAAAAAHQIMIEKHEENGRTVVSIHTLEEAERIFELARMIAGDQAGDITFRQAEEMLMKMGQG